MSTQLRVLMVEDSEEDAALIAHELRRGGYELVLQRVDSRNSLDAALAKEKWDLVISDYSMPHFSGIDALKLVRTAGLETPFIFVSGTMGEDTAVLALKLGAQDYVMKDNLKRLVPAIQRELREAELGRERNRLEQEVQRLQKFEAIGRLAGGIAHDFNNVLNVILGWAQLGYSDERAGSPSREKFEKIHDQAQRAAGLTAQLLAFARRQVLQPRNLELQNLIKETTNLLRSVIGEQIQLDTSLSSEPQVVRVDPTQIEQVLMNLCLNARDAMSKGGRLSVKTESVEISEDFSRLHSYALPGKYALLSVADTGTGMDAATLDRIFEPFFTTKEIGKGIGLGLATVYGIVKQHGGFVNVYSAPGQGTKFYVYLPLSTGVAETRPVSRTHTPAGGTETILVAEDHEGLRELLRITLTSLGYRLILASDGVEAVRLFQAKWEEIGLVVLDVVMPLLSGPDAYSQMCAIKPDLRVIFTSGHTAETVTLTSRINDGARFLQKPYSPQSLREAVRTALDETAFTVEGDASVKCGT